jgi:glycosyltransferase involved in cell wall biosynthesis
METISIITPSTRNEFLPIVEKCLRRQEFTDFEWIVVSPVEITSVKPDFLLKDPPKLKGDFWTLCKGWNKAYAHAKGDLIVNIQDGIWFPPDTLSKLWFHYVQKPRALVGAIGHQYEGFDEYGKPLNKVWHDPRSKINVSFEEVAPSEIEYTLNSIPKQALIECGGIDEEYDTCNGAQEKEMNWRLNKMGWDFFIDHSLEYRAIHHPRLTEDWDKVYVEKTTPLFVRHMNELETGTRTLNVDNLLKYVV